MTLDPDEKLLDFFASHTYVEPDKSSRSLDTNNTQAALQGSWIRANFV